MKNKLYRLKKKYDDKEIQKKFYEHIRKVNKQLGKMIRNEREKFRQEQAKEIEKLKKTDCKRMWLKRLSGWKSSLPVPETVLDEKGGEVEGEVTLGRWKDAFRKLGKEDMKDEKFDKKKKSYEKYWRRKRCHKKQK